MTKREFLNALNYYLSGFKKEERDEILYDYEEHFRIGMENGKTEEELIKELGNPKDIANQYRNSTEGEVNDIKGNSSRSIGGSILILIALALFNLIFIIGPYLGIVGALIGMCVGAIVVAISGVAVAFCTILRPMFPANVNIPKGIPDISVIFVGIGTTALGILFCIGMFYLIKFFIKLTVKYVKWNIKTIKGE